MNYTPLLKVMRGRPAMIEVGDETRQGVDVVKGFVWDLFFDNTILLMIVSSDDNVGKPPELVAQEAAAYEQAVKAQTAAQQAAAASGQQIRPTPITPPITVWPHREWHFKWVLVSNIIMVQTDGHVRINIATRQLTKPKVDPLYCDGLLSYDPARAKQHWEILNNHISKAIVEKLKEMGLQGDFTGVYRDSKNESVPADKAAFAVAPPPNPAPIPVPQIPPVNAVPVQAPVAVPQPAGV